MTTDARKRDTQPASAATNADVVLLSAACERLPRNPATGKTPCLHTVRAWVKRGVRGRGGQRVRLRAFRLGGRLYTRWAWIEEFVVACTEGFSEGVADAVRSPGRAAALRDARRRNIARGLHGEEAKRKLLGLP